MLMDVVSELAKDSKGKYHLTIIGEATGRLQKKFLEEVKQHIENNQMQNMVTILTNVPRKQTDEYFKETDVFVIPSTKEMASISQLEAMCFAIPVICSDSNGSACYVREGENGYLFKDCDREDLKYKLSLLLDKDKIMDMGNRAYQSILVNNSFHNYYKRIQDILEEMDKKIR